jgi:hypothetical protein
MSPSATAMLMMSIVSRVVMFWNLAPEGFQHRHSGRERAEPLPVQPGGRGHFRKPRSHRPFC